jgi:hypothetical protein
MLFIIIYIINISKILYNENSFSKEIKIHINQINKKKHFYLKL